MSVKELERKKTGATEPRKKNDRPVMWKVVMHYGSPDTIPCCACLLKDVFNMSSVTALRHVKIARSAGREVVYESTQEVAKEKAAAAEESRSERGKFCTPDMQRVSFVAEPA